MTDLEAQQPSSSSLLYLLTGCHIIKPEVITKLEQGEEPWVVEGEFLLQSHSGVCVGGGSKEGDHSGVFFAGGF